MKQNDVALITFLINKKSSLLKGPWHINDNYGPHKIGGMEIAIHSGSVDVLKILSAAHSEIFLNWQAPAINSFLDYAIANDCKGRALECTQIMAAHLLKSFLPDTPRLTSSITNTQVVTARDLMFEHGYYIPRLLNDASRLAQQSGKINLKKIVEEAQQLLDLPIVDFESAIAKFESKQIVATSASIVTEDKKEELSAAKLTVSPVVAFSMVTAKKFKPKPPSTPHPSTLSSSSSSIASN